VLALLLAVGGCGDLHVHIHLPPKADAAGAKLQAVGTPAPRTQGVTPKTPDADIAPAGPKPAAADDHQTPEEILEELLP
jgi:hypothetical protein